MLNAEILYVPLSRLNIGSPSWVSGRDTLSGLSYVVVLVLPQIMLSKRSLDCLHNLCYLKLKYVPLRGNSSARGYSSAGVENFSVYPWSSHELDACSNPRQLSHVISSQYEAYAWHMHEVFIVRIYRYVYA